MSFLVLLREVKERMELICFLLGETATALPWTIGKSLLC